MNFIAIETSTNICSVSLFINSELKDIMQEETREHSKSLPIFVSKLLNKKDLKLDYIALSIGPGSFTGLKVGTSFSKGLAAALSIPIIPINTFDGMKYDIKDRKIFYIATHSHRQYAFTHLYSNKVENSNFKCIEIDKLDNHQIYGYGFPDYCKVKYIKIKPSSEKIGLLSLKKFNSLKNKSIDNINPIYLMLET